MATPTTRSPSWKGRLYNAYVSSGQAVWRHDSLKKPEDLLRVHKVYFEQLIARYLPQDRECRIVDLGCGHGEFLHFLSRAGYTQISGIDISAQQIELAHKLGTRQAQVGDAHEFLAGQEEASLGAITLIDLIEHFSRQELFDLLDAAYRVLASGGICFAHVPNAEGLYGMRIRYGDLTHEIALTAKSAKQLFYAVGFRFVEVYEEKPTVHGFKSLIRRGLWDFLTLYPRLLLLAETGAGGAILSQNILIRATK